MSRYLIIGGLTEIIVKFMQMTKILENITNLWRKN